MYRGQPVLDYLYWAAVTKRLVHKRTEEKKRVSVRLIKKNNNCVCVAEQRLCYVFYRQVYVLKRPHVDEFLQKMGELFECVLFTASLAKVRLINTLTHLRRGHNKYRMYSVGFPAVAL